MTFGEALEALKRGRYVSRPPFHGWLFLYSPENTNLDFPAHGDEPLSEPYIVLMTRRSRMIWQPTQDSVLADNWYVVDCTTRWSERETLEKLVLAYGHL